MLGEERKKTKSKKKGSNNNENNVSSRLPREGARDRFCRFEAWTSGTKRENFFVHAVSEIRLINLLIDKIDKLVNARLTALEPLAVSAFDSLLTWKDKVLLFQCYLFNLSLLNFLLVIDRYVNL